MKIFCRIFFNFLSLSHFMQKTMNILLASTSTLFGGDYLDYLTHEITQLFSGIDEILFIPFARPSGITHEEYTEKVREFFSSLGIRVKGLHEFDDKARAVDEAKGFFTGSNIGGLNMKTTNDMPIVYPPSFECMALVPFNINPHYLDPNPDLKHNGETRETRIMEFLTQNDTKVIGLREGNWIRRVGDTITVEGSQSTRVFEKGKKPYEIGSGVKL